MNRPPSARAAPPAANPIPFIGADNTLRAGDTVEMLTGVIDHGLITASSAGPRDYKIHPTVEPVFERTHPRTAFPEPVGGNVKVASFNVLNYFTTIDQVGASCFPTNTKSDCRGADSALEARMARKPDDTFGNVDTAAADVALALASDQVVFYLGVALWGLHMGFSQGLLMTLIADAAPAHLRGSAFGLFALISGLIALAGNVAAGLLWDGFGPQATFAVGAVLSLVCALGVAGWMRLQMAGSR
jgi:hypothetical protein